MSLKSDGKLDLEDLWSDEIDKHGNISKDEKQEIIDVSTQKVGNKMKIIKDKKIYILFAVYIILIVTELFFCVPYNRIQIFVSTQNIPHTEIVGSGYAAITEIEQDRAYIYGTNKNDMGKRVNTPQLFMNVSITTFLAAAIYFLMQKNEKIKEMPEIDALTLAFATDEEVKKYQQDYARKMYNYVKGKEII